MMSSRILSVRFFTVLLLTDDEFPLFPNTTDFHRYEREYAHKWSE